MSGAWWGLQGPLWVTPSGPGSTGRVPRFTSSFAAGPVRARGVLGILRELAAALSATHVRTSPSWVPLPEGCSDPCPTARLWRQLAVGPLTSGTCFPPPCVQRTPSCGHLCAALVSAEGDVGTGPLSVMLVMPPSGSRLVGQESWI